MDIFFIHGDNYLQSYSRAHDFIKKAKLKDYDVKTYNRGDSLEDILRSRSLFSNKSFIFIQNFSDLKQKDIDLINKNSAEFGEILLIYKDKKLAKTQINKINNIKKIEEFEIPFLLWKFLDSFYPGNSKNCILLYEKLIINHSVELLFGLLCGLLADLYLIKNQLSEIENKWRLLKLTSQLRNFKDNQLEEIIKKCSEIDIATKTSTSRLQDSLAYLIVTQLE